MDKRTIEFYDREAVNLVGVYDSCDGGISDYFNTAFSTGMRILEIGCGSGRDLARLVDMGFDAKGVDPCRAFRDHAVKKYPCLKDRIGDDHLPELNTIGSETYDAVLCSGVLMHVPEAQVFDAVYAIRRVLRAAWIARHRGTVSSLSVCVFRWYTLCGGWSAVRDRHGR